MMITLLDGPRCAVKSSRSIPPNVTAEQNSAGAGDGLDEPEAAGSAEHDDRDIMVTLRLLRLLIKHGSTLEGVRSSGS
jgi:hypothetical protein